MKKQLLTPKDMPNLFSIVAFCHSLLVMICIQKQICKIKRFQILKGKKRQIIDTLSSIALNDWDHWI